MTGNSREDITLTLAIKFKEDLAAINKQIKDTSDKAGKFLLQNQKKLMTKDFNRDWNKGANVDIERAKEKAKALKEEINQNNKLKAVRRTLKETLDPEVYKRVQKEYTKLRKSTKDYMTQSQTMGVANKKVAASIKRVQVPFAGYAMSLMFFGMALKRTFDTIWKSSTKTFQDVSHSVEGTVTQFDLMEGSMKYLGFVVGQALEPMIGYLIPIIDTIADWVEQNPKLTATLVTLMGVLGTAFAVGGSAKLAYDGFVGLGKVIGGIKTKATALKDFKWSSLGNAIQSGIGIISIGFAFVKAKDAIENLKSGKVFSGLMDALESGLFAIGGGMLLKGNKAGGYLIGIGIGLELVQKGTLIQSIMSIMALLTSLFYTMGVYIGQLFSNGFIKMVKNAFIDFATNNPMFDMMKSVTGIDYVAKYKEQLGATGSVDFDFNKEFKEIYTAQMITAKKWDESISKVLGDLDAVTESMYHANEVWSGNKQLFESDSDFRKLMENNALNSTQLSKLLSLDAESGHGNTLSDSQWAMAEKEYKEQTGNYYTIESINVTTNDLADMLSQVNSLAGI